MNKSTSQFVFLAVTLKTLFFNKTFPQYHNCIPYSSLHTFTITMVQLKQKLNSAFSIIFLHIHEEASLDLWMGVNTLKVAWASLGNCIASQLWGKTVQVFLFIIELITEPNNTLQLNSDHFSGISFIHFAGFTTKYLPLYTIQWSLHSLKWHFPITVRLNAGKNTCTEQQYIVISNINDIKNIYL